MAGIAQRLSNQKPWMHARFDVRRASKVGSGHEHHRVKAADGVLADDPAAPMAVTTA